MAIAISNEGIQILITVNVSKGGGSISSHIHPVEGLTAACYFSEIAGTIILKVVDVAVVSPNEGIQIPITINVSKGGGSIEYHIHPVEGVTAACYFSEIAGTIILKVFDKVIFAPNEGIQISITINVSKGGGSIEYHIHPIEGVTAACYFSEVAGTIIFKVVDVAIPIPNESIQIPITVNIGKGGVTGNSHIHTIQGVCCASSFCKSSHD
nr:hypothetical protein [Okeania sp. SIO2G5]